MIGLTKSDRAFGYRFENWLQIECRAAYNCEHVGGGRLLLERLAQLAEQPRVLNSNDCLGGEVRDQLDLFVAEWAHLHAEDGNCADRLVVLKHRQGQHRADARDVPAAYHQRFALAVGRGLAKIDDMDGFSGFDGAKSRSVGVDAERSLGSPLLLPGRRQRAVERGATEAIALAKPHGAVTGLAKPGGILQHSLEYRLQFARRGADNL